MPRPPRNQTPGLIRHVMARGNGRMEIFLDDTDYSQFLYLVDEVVERFAVECRNYCLMPNHYHMTLVPRDANLSEAMRHLNGEYGKWWNKQHRKVGHVFQGRFKDQIVQFDEYYLKLCRYIDLNPVRACLAERPEDWRWSSYAYLIGLQPPPPFLLIDPTLRYFGDEQQQANYKEFVINQPEDVRLNDRIRSNERILGDRAFKKSMLNSMRNKGEVSGVVVAVPTTIGDVGLTPP